MNYQEFLESKMVLAPVSGFEVAAEEVHPALKPHQRDAVRWALSGGCRALFESFGLGKTVQELEWCRLVIKHVGGRALLVLPLGVRQEFTRDAVTVLDWKEPPRYVRTMAEVLACDEDIVMTNYERVRDGDINPAYFTATSLDEASVLRSFGSKTYQTFLDKFKNVPYKLVSTATPSPNKHKELVHYAGYLGVMDTGQALTRFFERDSTKANNLKLYPHKEKEFWLWVSTWALFISKPSDLGYEDAGYDLPALEVRYHRLESGNTDPFADKDGQLKIVRNAAMSLKAAAEEKRKSIDARVAKAKEIVDSDPEAHFILWHDLEDERRAIKKAMRSAAEVYGTLDLDIREQRVMDFADGEIRLLATKKEISGSGCNFQRHCHRAIFVGIDFEFNDFIQAIHRIHRFLQEEKVIIDIIYMDNEDEILRVLQRKWRDHDKLQGTMAEILQKYGLHSGKAAEAMKRSIGANRMEVTGKRYKAVLNDCIEETRTMEDSSVDLMVTSIPFSNHYEYTPSYNDLGHNEDTGKFFEQMDFLAPELLRVLKPGRIYACHVKDRVLFGSQTGTGMPTIEPFHADTIAHYRKHGFWYLGMITVLTDVVRENNQTYRLGWSAQCDDGSKMGVGCPEYVLLFRKKPTSSERAFADEKVAKSKEEYTRARWQIDAHAYWKSSGDRLMSREEMIKLPKGKAIKPFREQCRQTVYSHAEHVALAEELDRKKKLSSTFMSIGAGSWFQLDEEHRREALEKGWASEIWDDVNRMKTLNSNQRRRNVQMHLCPLQIDIVERLIARYSNKGETVYDPFGGLMTVPRQAVLMERRGIGCELNPDYFKDGVHYLETAEWEMEMPTLFDFVGGASPLP